MLKMAPRKSVGIGVGVSKDEGEGVRAPCRVSSSAMIARGGLTGDGASALDDELVSKSASYPEKDSLRSSSIVACLTLAAQKKCGMRTGGKSERGTSSAPGLESGHQD